MSIRTIPLPSFIIRTGTRRPHDADRLYQHSELYGGPSQPELSDPRGTVQKAHRLAEGDNEFMNPGQYDNDSVSVLITAKE